MPNKFTGDLSASPVLFPHFWEYTVGSGHATLALRADWQQQILRCHRELGFKTVRFHGILSDDMGTLVCENEQLVYSFFNADQVCDYLLSIGMRPFIEFSFMPLALSSGPDIVFHYKGNITPPHDYLAWETLIYNLVKHWAERYGPDVVRQWFFEIWNEPNLQAFWTGTREDYFLLYRHAATAIKSIDEQFQVGGPATASNAWITEFIDFCDENAVAFDFISTHHYPTDAFGKPGDDTIAQLAASTRSVLRDQVQATRKKAGDKPVYYTEWSTSSNPFDELHDMPYAAAFIIKTVMEARGQVQAYSYWTFSDIFEENYFSSAPFHGGFGLLTIHGIPKPSYRAFELLHRLGDQLWNMEGSHPTVDAWMSRKNNDIQVLLTNSALPRHPVDSEIIHLRVDHAGAITNVYAERIDDTHANAYAGWLGMDKPASLSPEQVKVLDRMSSLQKEIVTFRKEHESVCFDINIPPQGSVLITLQR